MLVDPGVVARLDASVLEAFEARSWIFVEFPAFRTVIAGCCWTVERSLAQTPIETDEVSAGLRSPRDSVRVDVAAANSDAGFRTCTGRRRIALPAGSSLPRPFDLTECGAARRRSRIRICRTQQESCVSIPAQAGSRCNRRYSSGAASCDNYRLLLRPSQTTPICFEVFFSLRNRRYRGMPVPPVLWCGRARHSDAESGRSDE